MTTLTYIFVASLLACFITTESTAESEKAANFNATAAATLLVNALSWNNKKSACFVYSAIWNNITGEQQKQMMNQMNKLFGHEKLILTRLYVGRYGFCHTDKNLSFPVPCMLKNDVQMDALILKSAMKDIGTDEKKLVEVFATRSNKQLREIARHYPTFTGSNLEEDLRSELSGDFEYFIFQMLHNGDRDQSRPVNYIEAAINAKKVYHYGLGGNRREMTDMFVRNNKQQLSAIFDEYKRRYHRSVATLFENSKFCEDSFDLPKFQNCDLRDALLAMVNINKDTPAYFAVRLHAMLKKQPENFNDFTDDPATIVLPRQYTDLKDIVASYRQQYGIDFSDDLTVKVPRYQSIPYFLIPPKVHNRDDYVFATQAVVKYSFGV